MGSGKRRVPCGCSCHCKCGGTGVREYFGGVYGQRGNGIFRHSDSFLESAPKLPDAPSGSTFVVSDLWKCYYSLGLNSISSPSYLAPGTTAGLTYSLFGSWDGPWWYRGDDVAVYKWWGRDASPPVQLYNYDLGFGVWPDLFRLRDAPCDVEMEFNLGPISPFDDIGPLGGSTFYGWRFAFGQYRMAIWNSWLNSDGQSVPDAGAAGSFALSTNTTNFEPGEIREGGTFKVVGQFRNTASEVRLWVYWNGGLTTVTQGQQWGVWHATPGWSSSFAVSSAAFFGMVPIGLGATINNWSFSITPT